MTQGRPASLKQIDDRFELDPEGFCGEHCKICKEKKYDLNIVFDVINPHKKTHQCFATSIPLQPAMVYRLCSPFKKI